MVGRGLKSSSYAVDMIQSAAIGGEVRMMNHASVIFAISEKDGITTTTSAGNLILLRHDLIPTKM
jgi:hypothetical protein